MDEDRGPEGPALGAIARYIAERDRDGARGALAYTAALVADGGATGEEVHAYCYELAANGIPYERWPDMVMAALAEPGTADALALRRARRDSLALSLVDYGENNSVSTSHQGEK